MQKTMRRGEGLTPEDKAALAAQKVKQSPAARVINHSADDLEAQPRFKVAEPHYIFTPEATWLRKKDVMQVVQLFESIWQGLPKEIDHRYLSMKALVALLEGQEAHVAATRLRHAKCRKALKEAAYRARSEQHPGAARGGAAGTSAPVVDTDGPGLSPLREEMQRVQNELSKAEYTGLPPAATPAGIIKVLQVYDRLRCRHVAILAPADSCDAAVQEAIRLSFELMGRCEQYEAAAEVNAWHASLTGDHNTGHKISLELRHGELAWLCMQRAWQLTLSVHSLNSHAATGDIVNTMEDLCRVITPDMMIGSLLHRRLAQSKLKTQQAALKYREAHEMLPVEPQCWESMAQNCDHCSAVLHKPFESCSLCTRPLCTLWFQSLCCLFGCRNRESYMEEALGEVISEPRWASQAQPERDQGEPRAPREKRLEHVRTWDEDAMVWKRVMVDRAPSDEESTAGCSSCCSPQASVNRVRNPSEPDPEAWIPVFMKQSAPSLSLPRSHGLGAAGIEADDRSASDVYCWKVSWPHGSIETAVVQESLPQGRGGGVADGTALGSGRAVSEATWAWLRGALAGAADGRETIWGRAQVGPDQAWSILHVGPLLQDNEPLQLAYDAPVRTRSALVVGLPQSSSFESWIETCKRGVHECQQGLLDHTTAWREPQASRWIQGIRASEEFAGLGGFDTTAYRYRLGRFESVVRDAARLEELAGVAAVEDEARRGRQVQRGRLQVGLTWLKSLQEHTSAGFALSVLRRFHRETIRMWVPTRVDARACELCYEKERILLNNAKRQLWAAADGLQQTELDLTLCVEALNSSLGQRFFEAKSELDKVTPRESESLAKKEMATEEFYTRNHTVQVIERQRLDKLDRVLKSFVWGEGYRCALVGIRWWREESSKWRLFLILYQDLRDDKTYQEDKQGLTPIEAVQAACAPGTVVIRSDHRRRHAKLAPPHDEEAGEAGTAGQTGDPKSPSNQNPPSKPKPPPQPPAEKVLKTPTGIPFRKFLLKRRVIRRLRAHFAGAERRFVLHEWIRNFRAWAKETRSREEERAASIERGLRLLKRFMMRISPQGRSKKEAVVRWVKRMRRTEELSKAMRQVLLGSIGSESIWLGATMLTWEAEPLLRVKSIAKWWRARVGEGLRVREYLLRWQGALQLEAEEHAALAAKDLAEKEANQLQDKLERAELAVMSSESQLRTMDVDPGSPGSGAISTVRERLAKEEAKVARLKLEISASEATSGTVIEKSQQTAKGRRQERNQTLARQNGLRRRLLLASKYWYLANRKRLLLGCMVRLAKVVKVRYRRLWCVFKALLELERVLNEGQFRRRFKRCVLLLRIRSQFAERRKRLCWRTLGIKTRFRAAISPALAEVSAAVKYGRAWQKMLGFHQFKIKILNPLQAVASTFHKQQHIATIDDASVEHEPSLEEAAVDDGQAIEADGKEGDIPVCEEEEEEAVPVAEEGEWDLTTGFGQLWYIDHEPQEFRSMGCMVSRRMAAIELERALDATAGLAVSTDETQAKPSQELSYEETLRAVEAMPEEERRAAISGLPEVERATVKEALTSIETALSEAELLAASLSAPSSPWRGLRGKVRATHHEEESRKRGAARDKALADGRMAVVCLALRTLGEKDVEIAAMAAPQREAAIQADAEAILRMLQSPSDGPGEPQTVSFELLTGAFEKASLKHLSYLEKEAQLAKRVKEASPEAKALFQSLDADGSGELDSSELLLLGRWVAETLTPPPRRPKKGTGWSEVHALEASIKKQKEQLNASKGSEKAVAERALAQIEEAVSMKRLEVSYCDALCRERDLPATLSLLQPKGGLHLLGELRRFRGQEEVTSRLLLETIREAGGALTRRAVATWRCPALLAAAKEKWVTMESKRIATGLTERLERTVSGGVRFSTFLQYFQGLKSRGIGMEKAARASEEKMVRRAAMAVPAWHRFQDGVLAQLVNAEQDVDARDRHQLAKLEQEWQKARRKARSVASQAIQAAGNEAAATARAAGHSQVIAAWSAGLTAAIEARHVGWDLLEARAAAKKAAVGQLSPLSTGDSSREREAMEGAVGALAALLLLSLDDSLMEAVPGDQTGRWYELGSEIGLCFSASLELASAEALLRPATISVLTSLPTLQTDQEDNPWDNKVPIEDQAAQALQTEAAGDLAVVARKAAFVESGGPVWVAGLGMAVMLLLQATSESPMAKSTSGQSKSTPLPVDAAVGKASKKHLKGKKTEVGTTRISARDRLSYSHPEHRKSFAKACTVAVHCVEEVCVDPGIVSLVVRACDARDHTIPMLEKRLQREGLQTHILTTLLNRLKARVRPVAKDAPVGEDWLRTVEVDSATVVDVARGIVWGFTPCDSSNSDLNSNNKTVSSDPDRTSPPNLQKALQAASQATEAAMMASQGVGRWASHLEKRLKRERLHADRNRAQRKQTTASEGLAAAEKEAASWTAEAERRRVILHGLKEEIARFTDGYVAEEHEKLAQEKRELEEKLAVRVEEWQATLKGEVRQGLRERRAYRRRTWRLLTQGLLDSSEFAVSTEIDSLSKALRDLNPVLEAAKARHKHECMQSTREVEVKLEGIQLDGLVDVSVLYPCGSQVEQRRQVEWQEELRNHMLGLMEAENMDANGEIAAYQLRLTGLFREAGGFCWGKRAAVEWHRSVLSRLEEAHGISQAATIDAAEALLLLQEEVSFVEEALHARVKAVRSLQEGLSSFGAAAEVSEEQTLEAAKQAIYL